MILVLHYMFIVVWSLVLFFFFKQKTAYEMRISDWSSDVCSSDLLGERLERCFQCGQTPFQHDAVEGVRPDAGSCLRCQFPRPVRHLTTGQIGRASCRERVCQYV